MNQIETIYEAAHTDGYRNFGSGKYFLRNSDAQTYASKKYRGYAISPMCHKAVKLDDGEYAILSNDSPVYITGSKKEKEFIAKQALAKLSQEEREALGF